MRILLLGATGFIGNNIFMTLIADYDITIAGRKPINNYPKWEYVDFEKEIDWDAILQNIDLVINCVGIITGNFSKIQTETPLILYKHCIEKDIAIIHISALGAELEEPTSDFLKSKKVTDTYLMQYKKARIVYPGIVLGKNGKSSQFFAELANLPLIPIINTSNIPFIHISQLTELIKDIIKNYGNYSKQIIAFSAKESLTDILGSIRGKKVKTIKIPIAIFRVLFTLFPKMSMGIFNKTTFDLSQRNLLNTYKPLFPKASSKIKENSIDSSNELYYITALLAISFIWIWSGVSSLISWNKSLELMNEIGANSNISPFIIYAGSLVDIFLGLALLKKKYHKPMILAQLAIMFIYMFLLSILAPHYWLHPFGVLTKNIPLIILSIYLYKQSK